MKNARVDVRLPQAEKEQLASMAKKAGISTGELIRRLSTGATLPTYGKLEAVKQVSKASADLARLGNLFKLSISSLSEALDDKRANGERVNALIKELANNQGVIMRGHQSLQDKIRQL